MPRKINRAITMAESRWRLQVFRADGSVESEWIFVNEHQALRAFDALAPSIPKCLQVRRAGKARYVTVESEGRPEARPKDAPSTDGGELVPHEFKAHAQFHECCEVCGEAQSHEAHGES
jgi:hypothetical protein